jgi:hypothetical protein
MGPVTGKMSDFYFSDRERGPRPRTAGTINPAVWAALRHLVQGRIEDGSLGYKFPAACPDGAGPCGCDAEKFDMLARAEIPELPEQWLWARTETLPDPLTILDILEILRAQRRKADSGGLSQLFRTPPPPVRAR